MAKFEFRLPSQDDIKNSTNGETMLGIINNDFDEKFSLITGCPGSGKTTVSIFRLIRLARNGKATILLTYQRMLKVAIENLLAKQGISTNKVNTLHQWYPRQAGRYLENFKEKTKLSSSEIESDLQGKVANMELILDEAQDLEERIFQAFPKVFGRITIGADNDQQMREGTGASESTIKRQLSHSLNEFTLQFNYRNTYQIYNFARYFVPDSPKANDSQTLSALRRYKNSGDLPEILKFKDQADMHDRLKTIINNYKGFNIGILFPFKQQVENYYSVISGKGLECSKYYAEMSEAEKSNTESNLKSILVTTFISAKGMEFDIVIMPEFDSLRNIDSIRKQAYVGCTRAKNRLVIMYAGSKPSILNNFPSDTFDTGDLF
ncbi:3'-5' exonuclease [Algoriphagus terrigena]|uniref:3'-5' exonuclease n=1 Tax=Algoriphagus terrigena TaxID=344884 RepID=UPI00041ADA71|nr:3'-5' exonuclease [Algoriphagus terrigena]